LAAAPLAEGSAEPSAGEWTTKIVQKRQKVTCLYYGPYGESLAQSLDRFGNAKAKIAAAADLSDE
jgi:hypothetical protein